MENKTNAVTFERTVENMNEFAGVEFFQEAGDEYYIFNTGNSAKILNVY